MKDITYENLPKVVFFDNEPWDLKDGGYWDRETKVFLPIETFLKMQHLFKPAPETRTIGIVIDGETSYEGPGWRNGTTIVIHHEESNERVVVDMTLGLVEKVESDHVAIDLDQNSEETDHVAIDLDQNSEETYHLTSAQIEKWRLAMNPVFDEPSFKRYLEKFGIKPQSIPVIKSANLGEFTEEDMIAFCRSCIMSNTENTISDWFTKWKEARNA